MKEVTFKNVKCKTGGLIPRKGDARYERYPNIEMTVEINNKRKAKEVADTLKDEVVERKMLGSAVVQRTKDMIDLIRGRLVVAQDGHDTKGQRVRNRGPSNVIGIPWKGLMRFGKKGKLSLQFVGPLDILRRLGS
ncbi:hypothetical protein AgCh_013321 [Apium graveolens]